MYQSRPRASEWRFSSRVMLPIAVMGSTAILLLAGLLFLATREADDISQERQARLVSHVLEESYDKVTRDQQSATIWDTAVRRTRGAVDQKWFDSNLGSWLYEYFGHDRTFVLDDEDQPIYAMSRG